MPKKKNIYEGLYTLRSDGRYQGYYRDREGKRHAVYDRDPAALYRKIQEKQAAEDAPKVLTFRDIAEKWYDEQWYNLTPGTQASYHAHYARALEFLGDYPVEEIVPFDIQRHLDLLGMQAYSVSTIKKQRVLYKLIFRYAMTTGACNLKYNPAQQPTIPKTAVKGKHRQAPEEDTILAIQRKAGTAYWGIFCLFLLCTGMRKGEALAIQWQDIDFQKKEISVTKAVHYRGSVPQITTTKTEAGNRPVPLLAPLEAALHRPENARDTDYVFCGSEDPSKPMSESTYNRKWMHYCKDMGFTKIKLQEKRISKQNHVYTHTEYAPSLTAHELRHGYATMLFEAGVDVYTAQKLLGHADLETTTQIYTHLRDKQKNQSIEKLRQYTQSGLQ